MARSSVAPPCSTEPHLPSDCEAGKADCQGGIVCEARVLSGVIVLLQQIDTVRLKKTFWNNDLVILRFALHCPFFADWHACPPSPPLRASPYGLGKDGEIFAVIDPFVRGRQGFGVPLE